jgi:uncharacterized damage-inducible protein DinB
MDLIVEFMRHNSMMNRRLLDACGGLSADQLAASVDGTYGALGSTLVHLTRAQDAYVARFFGDERRERLEDEPFPGFDVLEARLTRSNARLEEAAALAGGPATVQVTGDDPVGTWSMPRMLLLLQAVNHATEHRSQAATILTQLGIEPPDMSGWAYFADSGHMTDV